MNKPRLAILCVTVWFAFSAFVAAQEIGAIAQSPGASGVNPDEAIPLGPFLFTPTLDLTWERRDNIQFTPDHEIADDVYMARARLLFELPKYENYLRFSYSPQYRDYGDYDYKENWGHFFDVASNLEFANGLRLAVEYKFITSAMETREVDPGGELVPGEDRFWKHHAGIVLDYWLNERDAISAELSFDDTEMDDQPVSGPFFYDYQQIFYGLGWIHQLSPILSTELRYRHTDYDAFDTLDYRDSAGDELTLGLTGQINDVLSSGLHVGYRKTSYDTSPGDPSFDDYSSVIARGNIGWELAHGSTLRLDLLRSNYGSNYDRNAYYTATGASVIYDLTVGRIDAQARVRYQENGYEVADTWYGGVRTDEILTLGLGIGFRFTEILSLRGVYLFEDRGTSFDDVYGYTTNIFALGLVVGY